MLYKLTIDGDKTRLEPHVFRVYPGSEKDLENMLVNNLFEILFEYEELMPVCQERKWQPEADIYALDKDGNLAIFELKLGSADRNATLQVLRYAEHAGRWTYGQIEEKYRKFKDDANADLKQEFEKLLGEQLDPEKINRKQRLFVIGSAADNSLVEAVDYWREQGVMIDFLPYRVYEFEGEQYFEFFTPPYDKHSNPGDRKGVLFDTNSTYYEEDILYMMKHSRVAARGDARRFVKHVYPGDKIFFYHRGAGIVAAGEVKKGDIQSDGNADYREVEMLTPVPETIDGIKAMPAREVSIALGKKFYWARTIKVPYLSRDESKILLEALKQYLSN